MNQGIGLQGLLSPKELATLLNLKEGTLRVWRTRGFGPPYLKLGRAVRYNPADVDAWLQQRQRAGGGAYERP